MKLAISELANLGLAALKKQGHPTDDARAILDVLMYAQLRGNDQGLIKLVGDGIPADSSVGEPSVRYLSNLSAVIDGAKNNGILVMRQATKLLTEIAASQGFGIVSTTNTNTSTGAIGFYAREIAETGLISFVFAGSRPTVAPLGSYQPLFGTNPIAVGIPAEGRAPIVIDMATSAITWYSVVAAENAHQQLPEGVAFDASGRPTQDPAAAMRGALRTFDRGHKSFALAFLVEILTRSLAGAPVGEAAVDNWGNLAFAISPALLGELTAFQRSVTELIAQVRGLKTLPDVEEVRLPGERGDKLSEFHHRAQHLDIDDALVAALEDAAGLRVHESTPPTHA